MVVLHFGLPLHFCVETYAYTHFGFLENNAELCRPTILHILKYMQLDFDANNHDNYFSFH
jgi:hypothetical protein